MALNDYARARVFFNGLKLQQITSAQMETDGGQQPVNLLDEGLSGFTPGAGSVTLTIGYAIPRDGTEEPFQETCAVGRYATLQYGRGDKDYVGTGKIMNVSESQSTGANLEGTFTWMGKIAPMR